MTALISRLMAPDTATVIATVLGLAVCAFTAALVVFDRDPERETAPTPFR